MEELFASFNAYITRTGRGRLVGVVIALLALGVAGVAVASIVGNQSARIGLGGLGGIAWFGAGYITLTALLPEPVAVKLLVRQRWSLGARRLAAVVLVLAWFALLVGLGQRIEVILGAGNVAVLLAAARLAQATPAEREALEEAFEAQFGEDADTDEAAADEPDLVEEYTDTDYPDDADYLAQDGGYTDDTGLVVRRSE